MASSQQHNINLDPSDPPAVAHKQHGEKGKDENTPNLSFWGGERMIFVTSGF